MKLDLSRMVPRLLVPAAALLVSACVVEAPIRPGMAATQPDTAMGQADFAIARDGDYMLRPHDVISVTIFREPELSLAQVVISAEGRISVPLIGPIEAAGMTVDQLETRLEQLYDQRYLRGPDIAVNVIEYGSHIVTVEGSVERPGVYNFRPGTRLSAGIALAAGTRRVANPREVAVFRETPQGTMIAKFDYVQVRAGGMLDPVLQPGDRIVVGTDNLSQTWQDLLRALPAFGLFTQL